MSNIRTEFLCLPPKQHRRQQERLECQNTVYRVGERQADREPDDLDPVHPAYGKRMPYPRWFGATGCRPETISRANDKLAAQLSAAGHMRGVEDVVPALIRLPAERDALQPVGFQVDQFYRAMLGFNDQRFTLH